MEKLAITCSVREAAGKGVARKLRQDGKIPGILYGGDGAVSLTLDPKDILRVLNSQAGENAIVQLNLSGEKTQERKVILRELQYDSIRRRLLHVDFYEVTMDEELEVRVPVEMTGVPVGVEQDGGVLTQLLFELHIKCLPDEIPDQVFLDVSELNIGDARHVSDLTVPTEVTVLDDLETAVVNVEAPRVEVVVEEEVEEEVEVDAEEKEEVEDPAAEKEPGGKKKSAAE
ncbi:MAG: 50S ribosomal protein L25 [bacterium]|nr:50S ribosomal protein L25 [bacterium]